MDDFNVKAFKITFLGTSAASLSPVSSTSACLVEAGKTRILVDAGIGALRQLRKVEVSPDMLDAVLLTHWHFDHCAGLPGLVRSRKKDFPLPIYAPKPPLYMRIFLCAIFSSIFKNFMLAGTHFSVEFPDIYAKTFETTHKIASLGWILSENPFRNRWIVISGDSRPTESIIQAARGADLLIHEATYLEKHSNRAIINQHSTAKEAANLAIQSEVGGLALTHTASRYSIQEMRKEVQNIFPGAIIPSPLITIFIEPLAKKVQKEGYGWANIRVVNNIK